ncbi:MAG TPA: hypothetical protein VJY62_03125, partial [Bacteroidia bacterium]|nr:hypothetical protein [Bacteroidia bacterium]
MIIINCFLGSVFSEWILTNKDVISTLSAFVTLISAVVAVRSDKTIQENKKTGKKHLSGFGVMTLIIIFLSCIVQYLVQYAQKSVDQLKTYNEDIEKRIQDSIFRERFVVQMYRFDSITNNFQVVNTRMKSQDSLDAMRFERNITRLKGLSQSVFDLYYDFKMSSETASENFKKTNIEQENIVKQQLNIAENINRTLNPFIPFGISFTINIKVNTNDTSNYHNESLLYARNNLLKAIERFDKKNKSPIPIFGGLTKMDSEGEPMYVINQDYKNMADFNFIECPIYLSFDIMSA